MTSWVSRPEFSAKVLGITRRASANASTPSCARCCQDYDISQQFIFSLGKNPAVHVAAVIVKHIVGLVHLLL